MSIEADMSRTIIVAYDESDVGHKMIEWVRTHKVLLPDDTVHLVTVLDEDITKYDGPGGAQWAAIGGMNITKDFFDHIRDLEKNGRERLAEAASGFHEDGITNIKPKILRGAHPGEAIQKYADEIHPDIVICGNRGLGYLKRKLMGSVSEHLVNHLSYTVMVVR
ncbi:hypothetical protein BDB01DRAFT_769653 [Pilobolus umbonatus]|nr:hypothetical protein BDB01DRAFT_769653 [Pilobolus umbonatus]